MTSLKVAEVIHVFSQIGICNVFRSVTYHVIIAIVIIRYSLKSWFFHGEFATLTLRKYRSSELVAGELFTEKCNPTKSIDPSNSPYSLLGSQHLLNLESELEFISCSC